MIQFPGAIWMPGFDMGDRFLIGFCRFPVSIERQIRGLRDFWGQYSESSVGTIISL